MTYTFNEAIDMMNLMGYTMTTIDLKNTCCFKSVCGKIYRSDDSYTLPIQSFNDVHTHGEWIVLNPYPSAENKL